MNENVKVHFSKHAVRQYRDRVKPGMKLSHARKELERLAPGCEVAPEPPFHMGAKREDCVYLLLTDGVALPLVKVDDGLLAVTCLVRGGRTPEERRRRSQRREADGRIPRGRAWRSRQQRVDVRRERAT